MVAIPTPTIVTMFLATVATVVSELLYVNEPLLFVVGATKAKGAFPNTFSGTVKLESVAVVLFTMRVAVVVPLVLFGVLACTAVMIVKPTPTIVTVFPTTVATNELELVYVNAPVLLVVGASIWKGASLGTFVGMEKLVKTVVIRLTWKGAVVVADV